MKRFLLSALIGLTIVSGLQAASIFGPLGVGMTQRHETARSAAIAGSDGALSDSVYFPMDNPAGWFNVGYTRYTASMNAVKITATDAGGSDTADDFNFPGMAFAMPIYRSLGLGFAYQGVTDYEFLTYRYDTLTPEGSSETYDVIRRLQGSGGLAKVATNIGAKVRPWLAVGIAADYYFGKTERLGTLTFTNGDFYRSGEFRRDQFSGTQLRAGAIGYIGRGLQVAGVLELPTNLRVHSTLTVEGGDSTDLGRSDYGLPLGATVSGAYTRERTRFSGQASFRQWGEASRVITANDTYTTAYDLGLGFERLPLRTPLEPWYQKWIYRAGVRMGQHYIEAGGNAIQSVGFSVGLGIPLRTHPGIFDLAFTYDIRGSEGSNLGSERIIGFKVGFGSSEKWFVRRKR